MSDVRAVPTLEDVARVAGVSRATVSRVVNGATIVAPETTKMVQAAISQLGYQPNRAARALVTRRTGVIAVVVPETDERVFTDPYFPQAYHGALQGFGKVDMHVVLAMAEPGTSPAKMVRYLESGHVDGAIIVSHHGPELGQLLSRAWLPVVFVGDPETPGIPYVDLDNRTAARIATEHLIERGATRIGHISGPLEMDSSRKRILGFEDAMAAAGLDASLRAEGEYTSPSGRVVLDLLAERPDIDGLFVANDLMAATAVAAIQETGRRVPDDVRIVGFDNSVAALQPTPQLTTMVNAAAESTRIAAEMLIEILGGGRPESPVVLHSSLVRRGST
jgi:DNA-binding LacI/PurR family transcriptional regulator